MASFKRMTTAGRILVNPSLNKSEDSLTVHVETANPRLGFLACFCEKPVSIVIRPYKEGYKKLFVVLDKTVIHEFELPHQSWGKNSAE